MKPRITVITIGVDDLERALSFYRDGLGLKTEGIIGQEFDYGAVVFFELEGGARLALWPRKSISHDTGLPVSSASRRSSRSGTTSPRRRKWTPSWPPPKTPAPSS